MARAFGGSLQTSSGPHWAMQESTIWELTEIISLIYCGNFCGINQLGRNQWLLENGGNIFRKASIPSYMHSESQHLALIPQTSTFTWADICPTSIIVYLLRIKYSPRHWEDNSEHTKPGISNELFYLEEAAYKAIFTHQGQSTTTLSDKPMVCFFFWKVGPWGNSWWLER